MKKMSILGAAMGAITLAACSTPPTAPLPDGSHRVPVNQDMSLQGTAVYPRPPMAQVKFADASQAPLPLPVIEKPAPVTVAAPKPPTPIQNATAAVIEQARFEVKIAQANNYKRDIANINERLNALTRQVISVGNVLIVAEYKSGESAFKPENTMGKVIVDMAQISKSVSVHGRTDSPHYTNSNRKVAIQRAISVRNYLVSHGVDKNKIRVVALASGDFIAPDNTEKGRSLNRRVEIDFVQS